jgi:DNA-binding ferritin-like protein (Dps family)
MKAKMEKRLPKQVEKKVKMTPKEFAEKMKKIFKGDYSVGNAHEDADDLMCNLLKSLGYEEGIENFENAKKWYA